jgi:hypothetical protein
MVAVLSHYVSRNQVKRIYKYYYKTSAFMVVPISGIIKGMDFLRIN